MWDFSSRADKVGAPDPKWALLNELDALNVQQQDDTAHQLALLWSGFIAEFGGPRPFVQHDEFVQRAYLARLDRVAERSAGLKSTDLGRYYYSVSVLRRFLEVLRTHDTSPVAIALSKRVVWLTERGRRRTMPRSARSAALLLRQMRPSARKSVKELQRLSM